MTDKWKALTVPDLAMFSAELAKAQIDIVELQNRLDHAFLIYTIE